MIFTDNADIVDTLADEQAGIVFKALLHSQLGDDVRIQDQAALVCYKTIIKQVQRCHDRYDKRVEAGRKNIGKRWIASDSNHIATDSKPIATDSKVYNPVPVPVRVPDKDKKSIGRFSPPTVQQVREYAAEKGYILDADRFVDFYECKGWMVGKNKMKDWKAAARNWARSQRQETTAKDKPAGKFNSFPQRNIDIKSLEKTLAGGKR